MPWIAIEINGKVAVFSENTAGPLTKFIETAFPGLESLVMGRSINLDSFSSAAGTMDSVALGTLLQSSGMQRFNTAPQQQHQWQAQNFAQNGQFPRPATESEKAFL
jgi:hypothetical protein